MDVNAIDLVGAAEGDLVALEVAAADNLKRVLRADAARDGDWTRTPGLERLLGYLETKTVWHPIGV
jgi:hypothetical protein